MNCDKFKEWLINQEQYDQKISQAAKDHTVECVACRKLYTADSMVEDQLIKGLKKVDPPDKLFEKIEMNINSEARRNSNRNLWGAWKKIAIPMAAAAMLLFFLNPFGTEFKSLEEISKMAVNDHLSKPLMTFSAGEVVDVPAWFENKVRFKVVLPDVKVQGLKFTGGRKCHLGKNDVAYLFYEKDGKRVSLFIVDSNDIGFDMEKKGEYLLVVQKCKVNVWKDADLLYAMVE